MDYILKRLNRKIEVSQSTDLETLTLSRERIEYCLFFILSILWNRNFDELILDDKAKVVNKLQNLQIGDLISIIRDLDISKLAFNTKITQKALNNYPTIRNSKIGHGYTHTDDIEKLIIELENLYEDITANINLLIEEWTLVYVQKKENDSFTGIRYSYQDNGLPDLWTYKNDNYDFEIGRTYAYNKNMNYIKLSPFINIDTDEDKVYVFCKLKEKLIGKVVLNRLFNTEIKEREFKELAEIYAEDDEHKVISTNLTIMNKFDNNYKHYINVGVNEIQKNITNFLVDNNSNVSATVWGHGGIGKTACVQNICRRLFNNDKKEFDYIIFLSAKDRIYNTFTGKIEDIDYLQKSSVKTYEDIILSIGNILCNKHLSASNNIDLIVEELIHTKSKVLIIIDDLETFPKKEISKIENLIEKLDVHLHKLIFTTRSKNVIGKEISLNELNETEMISFIKKIIINSYPKYIKKFDNICKNSENIKKIYDATGGRTIFLFQFVHIFTQDGLEGETWKNIKSTEEAKEFLYGKVYTYLSKSAQILFCGIYVLISEENLIFNKEFLKFIVKKFITEDQFEEALNELIDLKIIEILENNNIRLYAKELVEIISNEYEGMSSNAKAYIKAQFKKLGGKDAAYNSIYQARLEEANKLRYTGNKFEVEENYRNIIKMEDSPYDVRKKALCNLASYYQITQLSNNLAINLFNDFYSFFSSDMDVSRLYSQALWAEGEKQKAYKIIEKYFSNNNVRLENNLELFGMFVAYRVDELLNRYYELNEFNLREKSEGKDFVKAYEKLLDEMISVYKKICKKMFSYITNEEWKRFAPKVKHNLEMAISQCIKLLSIIGKAQMWAISEGKIACCLAADLLGEQYQNGIKKYKKSFEEIYDKIEEYNSKGINISNGDKLSGIVTNVKNYGAFIKLSKEHSGLLHISGLSKHFIQCIYNDIQVGEERNVIVETFNNKQEIQLKLYNEETIEAVSSLV